ncbi:MAG: hypothetical protein KDJ52_17155 [Anaerolineae bacterium]|nr:hypothetical protein [Anaerolineae bacterium]MCB0211070.1 hypothetical protein [Anaerolineae bacterium]
MRVEQQPNLEFHPEPNPTTASEMTFEAAMRRAVDDLFVCQAIAERLHAVDGGDESVAAFIDAWKQRLTEHLTESAELAVSTVVTGLDLLYPGLLGLDQAYPTEAEEVVQPMYQPFTVASICRNDLKGLLSDDEIACLRDNDLADIADRMSDVYRDSGGYWESLETMARIVMKRNQESESSDPVQADESPTDKS